MVSQKLICLILGIDPGLKGGLVLLNSKRECVFKEPMPLVGKELDVLELRKILSGWEIEHCWIEQVHALPKVGAGSSFKFGKVVGQTLSTLSLSGIGYNLVSPRTWQKELGLAQRDGSTKERALQASKRLFPKLDLTISTRSRKPHDGLVDALLIAEYGLRRLNYKSSHESISS